MARTVRALSRLSVQSPSTSSGYAVASSSSRSLSSTPIFAAQKKPPPMQKTKSKKRPGSSGPRSTGTRRKGGSEGGAPGSGAQSALNNPFYKQPADMSWLPVLTPESAGESDVSKAFAWNASDLDAFDKAGVEQKIRTALASYLRPASIVRPTTQHLYKQLSQSASASPSASKESPRIILNSALSSGKSYLVMQAVSYALASQWLVVYLPRLVNWVNSTSSFTYSSEEQAYLQPDLVRHTLDSVTKLNAKSRVLSKISIPSDRLQFDSGVSLSQGATAADLCKLVAGDASMTPLALQQAFDAFLAAVSGASNEVPTLLALDDVQCLYAASKYRDADFKTIQGYELGPVRSLIQFIAGQQGLGIKKGATVAAVSRSHSDWVPGSELQLVLSALEKESPTVPGQDPASSGSLRNLNKPEMHAYTDVHPLHLSHVQASKWSVFPMADIWSEDELRALFELRRKEGRSWNLPSPVQGNSGAIVGGGGTQSSPAQPRSRIGFQSSAAQASSTGTTSPSSVLSSARSIAMAVNDSVRGKASEDEIFWLRVMDSGRNPAKFDRALTGWSAM